MIRTGTNGILEMNQEDTLRVEIPIGRLFKMSGVGLDKFILFVEESNAGDMRCYDCWFNGKCGNSWFKIPKCSKWRRNDNNDVIFKEIQK